MWEVEDDSSCAIGNAAKNGNFAMLKYIVEVMKREIGDRDFDDEGDIFLTTKETRRNVMPQKVALWSA